LISEFLETSGVRLVRAGLIGALLLTAGACMMAGMKAPAESHIGAAVARGASHLKSLIAADEYKLDCRASDGSPCPVHETGHVFAGYRHVSPSAAPVLRVQATRNLSIAGAQTADGWWRSYFYPGRYYGTYMSLRLLCKTGSLPESRRKGLSFLLGSRNPDGSWGSPGNIYETCLALNALAACGARGEAFRSGIARLIAWQRPDGSWRDERAVIWEFTYRDKPIIWRAHDARGVVTTALAVKALRSAQDGGAQ